jgi:hypothetical protein
MYSGLNHDWLERQLSSLLLCLLLLSPGFCLLMRLIWFRVTSRITIGLRITHFWLMKELRITEDEWWMSELVLSSSFCGDCLELWLTYKFLCSEWESQSYFMTGGLPPVSLSWCQAPWEPQPEIFFFQLNSYGNSAYVTSSLTRYGFVSYEDAWLFIKCTFCTYTMLLKIPTLALYRSPVSVQTLQSISYLRYVSYATTAA